MRIPIAEIAGGEHHRGLLNHALKYGEIKLVIEVRGIHIETDDIGLAHKIENYDDKGKFDEVRRALLDLAGKRILVLGTGKSRSSYVINKDYKKKVAEYFKKLRG